MLTQYAVSIPCTNKSGEISKLLAQVIGIFLSLSCKHVLHRAYGDSKGIQFSLAVPDEHETCGIVERFFSSVQRRARANLLAFLEDDLTLIEFNGLDAMVYASNILSLLWSS